MRIDTPIKIRGLPGGLRRRPSLVLRHLGRALVASFEDNTPTLPEVVFFSVLGLVFGYSVQAYSYQAVIMTCVIIAGAAWGIVLGLLLDRLHQHLTRSA